MSPRLTIVCPAVVIGFVAGLLASSLSHSTANAAGGGPEGPCCVDGGCVQLPQSECEAAGGEWGEPGEGCAFCDRPCCVPAGDCLLLFESQCEGLNGVFFPEEFSCLAVDCSNTCLGDVTSDGNVGVEDLLTVIVNWGECP